MYRLVIDIDGVLCDHADAICRAVNSDYGTSAIADDVTTWNHNFGQITFFDAVKKYYPDDTFIRGMQPHAGADEFVRRMSRFFEVIIASARTDSHDATSEWVRMCFGSSVRVEFVKQKAALRPDIVIEDYLPELQRVCEDGGIGILLKRPWNDNSESQGLSEQRDDVFIVRDFGEACSVLRSNRHEIFASLSKRQEHGSGK